MVQHNPWFKFSFVSKLLSCIPIPKTKENNIKTRLKLNHNANIYSHFSAVLLVDMDYNGKRNADSLLLSLSL